MSLLLGTRSSLYGESWNSVKVPHADFSFVPFDIQRKGKKFRPHPSWDIREEAGITVAKTYYVDAQNGDNANDGSDWDNAFETLKYAWEQADYDRIYATGRFIKSQQSNFGTRDHELIGVGECILTSDITAAGVGAWSKVDNHYEAAVTEYVGSAWDESNLDEYGLATQLDQKSSVAEVDAALNSFWIDWVAREIYVRTFDDRAPDADIICYDSLAFYIGKDEQTVYVENIEIFPSTSWRNASATGGLKVYAKDCVFASALFAGLDMILQDCTFRRSWGDGADYNDRNGVRTKCIEIDCRMSNFASGGSDQTSTAHGDSRAVRIGGEYGPCAGQVIADVGTSKTWMLGVIMHDSEVAEDGFYAEEFAWLDRCHIYNCPDSDLIAEKETIYIRQLTSNGVFTGTVEAY